MLVMVPVPDNTTEQVWWLFNGVLIVLLWMIRSKLTEITKELRFGRNNSLWLVNAITSMRTRCALLHPHEPLAPLPDPPKDE